MVPRFLQPVRGVQLHGHPEGFFLRDLLWFADAGSATAPVSRGFEVLPADPTGLGAVGLLDLRHRLTQTLAMLGSNQSLQVRWTIDSDYRAELRAFDAVTDGIEREVVRKEEAGEWLEADAFALYHRRNLFARAWEAMERGELERERLHLYVGRTLPLPSKNDIDPGDYRNLLDRAASAEAKRIDDLFGSRLRGLHPDAAVRAMTDDDHFLRAEYFSDPLRKVARGDSPLRRFDPGESIGLNCFTRQWRVPPVEPGVSYVEGGVPHALVVLLTPPVSTYPAEVPTMVRSLGFRELEIIVNIRPLDAQKVAARLERESNETGMVLKDRGDQRFGENVRQGDKRERILAYRSGERLPFAVLYTFHLWAPTASELRGRVENLKMAVEGWQAANAMLVTLPGSVRHTYANNWPGWWCGSLKHYFMELDDVNVADMLPWSSTFHGEPDGAEAMFEGPRRTLVFVRTRSANGQPRHFLVVGKTGSGKSTFNFDLFTQIRHTLDFSLIAESGLSFLVNTLLEGVEPLVISANSNQTLNPFDPDLTPLSSEFFAFLTTFLLGRMGISADSSRSVSEQEEVALRRGVILENLHALYDQVFRSWAQRAGDSLQQLRRFVVVVNRRHQALQRQKADAPQRQSLDMSFSDVALDLNSAITGDDPTRQQLALEAIATVKAAEIEAFTTQRDSFRMMRDVSFLFMAPDMVPTLGRFVAMLDGAPVGDPRTHDLCQRISRLLLPWCARGGSYGILFDGPATVRIRGKRFHVETGKISEQPELREATNYVIAGMAMQHIKRLPRSQRKLIHFPELPEMLVSPGGQEMLLLLSTQLRKYNGVLGGEIQQYDILRRSPVQATLWANTTQRFILRQPDPQDAYDISERARLSPPHAAMIRDFPEPGPNGSHFLLNVEGGASGPAVCRPGPVLVYAADSSGSNFDKRRTVLAQYSSLAMALIAEGEAEAQRAAQAEEDAIGIPRVPGLSHNPLPSEQKLLV